MMVEGICARDSSTQSVNKEVEVHCNGEPTNDSNLKMDARSMTDRSHSDIHPDGPYQTPDKVFRYEMNGPEKDGRVLEVVLSRVGAKSSWEELGPPPDGGWSGWMQGVYLSLLSSPVFDHDEPEVGKISRHWRILF